MMKQINKYLIKCGCFSLLEMLYVAYYTQVETPKTS